MTTENKNPWKVAVVLYIDGEIPIFLRKSKDGLKTWYDLPGGKPDLDENGNPLETPFETATRELREELDVEIEFIRSLGHEAHPYNKYDVVFMACKSTAGTAKNLLTEEHEAMEKISPLEAIKKLGNRINANTIEYIANLAPTPDVNCNANPEYNR